MENIKSNKNDKARRGKRSSRLQKQAPSNLQISSGTSYTSLSEEISSCVPIPLLSPLILSPILMPDNDDKGALDRGVKQEQGRDNKKGGLEPVTSNGWQHPASSSLLPETSSLFSSFQSQCMLVHHPQ